MLPGAHLRKAVGATLAHVVVQAVRAVLQPLLQFSHTAIGILTTYSTQTGLAYSAVESRDAGQAAGQQGLREAAIQDTLRGCVARDMQMRGTKLHETAAQPALRLSTLAMRATPSAAAGKSRGALLLLLCKQDGSSWA